MRRPTCLGKQQKKKRQHDDLIREGWGDHPLLPLFVGQIGRWHIFQCHLACFRDRRRRLDGQRERTMGIVLGHDLTLHPPFWERGWRGGNWHAVL